MWDKVEHSEHLLIHLSFEPLFDHFRNMSLIFATRQSNRD